MNEEIRVIGNVKVRSEEEGKESNDMTVEGYALKFNTESEEMWHYTFEEGEGSLVETISPNALDETDMSDVRYLFNHDRNIILGRSTAGSLDLKVDDEGLYYKAKLPNTTTGRDTYENIRNGNITQCSFAMMLEDEDYEVTSDGKGNYRGVVQKIRKLLDVSAVTYPAYKDTNVGVARRSVNNDKKDSKKALEKELRSLKSQMELEILREEVKEWI